MACSFSLLRYFPLCLLSVAVVCSTSPFLPNTPGREWRMVGHLDMTDPTQQCPDSWQRFTSPRSSCGKKTTTPCDSLSIPTSGASYQTVCGRFRGYQIGSPDAFYSTAFNVETGYMDGISITYGSPGNRHHVYTYAAGVHELKGNPNTCPCTGDGFPSVVGSDYYCESGNPGPDWNTVWYSSDVLWDGQQCGGNESTCCNSTNLPWFCKTFPTPISEDLEVRICTNEALSNENVAIESFELYIQVTIPSMNIRATSVLNPDTTLRHLEISWIPVVGNVTSAYTMRVVGADSSVGHGFTVCTTSPCLYVHQVTRASNNFTIFVTSLNGDGTLGSQDSTAIYGPTSAVFQNTSFLSYNNSISCSFQTNQSLYCMACCSTDPSVPPDSSVYNISTTRGTKVTVSLQGLISGQMYYCKVAATNTSFTRCADRVVGGVKIYFSFVASFPP